MDQPVPHGWTGVDIEKDHHWVYLTDDAGATVWSAKVDNDEDAILEAVGTVLGRADPVVWAVDVTGTSGLLLPLLGAHGQQLKYPPGCTVHQIPGAYRSEARTDARDACRGEAMTDARAADVIAETVQNRADLAKGNLQPVEARAQRLLPNPGVFVRRPQQPWCPGLADRISDAGRDLWATRVCWLG